MKEVRIELPQSIERLELHIFSDLHIGDPQCDYKLIKDRIARVENTEDAYCVLNGDILNNATKTSVSDVYGEVLPPMEQIDRAVDLFAPIKNKILAMTRGNHEARTYNKEGIDPSLVMARQLGAEDKYSPEGVLLWVSFGESSRRRSEGRRTTYSIYMTHGTGGGRTEGAKANRVAQLASVVDADIYLHAHLHLPLVMRESFCRVSQSTRSCSMVDKLFINTAAGLNYGGYGQAMAFKPSSKKNPVLYLNGQRRDMSATL